MSDAGKTSCPVDFSGTLQRGEYANAFRIVGDMGQDLFLDFLVYSPAEHRAYVVARIRIHKTFLPAIRQRCHETLVELVAAAQGVGAPTPTSAIPPPPPGPAPIPKESILVQDENGVVYFIAPQDKGEAN